MESASHPLCRLLYPIDIPQSLLYWGVARVEKHKVFYGKAFLAWTFRKEYIFYLIFILFSISEKQEELLGMLAWDGYSHWKHFRKVFPSHTFSSPEKTVQKAQVVTSPLEFLLWDVTQVKAVVVAG